MWSFFYLINKKANLAFFIWSPFTDGCVPFSLSQSNLQHLILIFEHKEAPPHGKALRACGACMSCVCMCVIMERMCMYRWVFSGSVPVDVSGKVACPRTGPSHRRGVFKGLVWRPMGAANTAHLLLQFYFHIISISKSCLAALAVALDKRRVGEGMEERQKRRRKRRNVCWYARILRKSDSSTFVGMSVFALSVKGVIHSPKLQTTNCNVFVCACNIPLEMWKCGQLVTLFSMGVGQVVTVQVQHYWPFA